MNSFVKLLGRQAALSGLFVVSLLLFGCGGEKKVTPLPVGEMEDYRDPGYGFHVSHPKGWIVNAEVGRAGFYSVQDADKKFLDPTGNDPAGAAIMVIVKRTATPADDQKSLIDEMKRSGMVVDPETQVAVNEKQGTKVGFKANYGPGAQINGYHVFIAQDSLLYDLTFQAFGDLFTAHQNIFEASLNSFRFPKPTAPGADLTLPSETFTKGENKFFTYEYPENFNFSALPKSTFELSQELRGYRQDCSVRFDVFDAKNLTVDKVFEQNKGKYRAKATGRSTIGGGPALYLTYSPSAQVESRAYFTVHNGKVLRVTTNYFKPQEKEYTAAFEKIIASIRFRQ